MIIKINEIDERCSAKDKIELIGKITNVYKFENKPGKFGKIGNQNIVIEDDTGSRTVKVNIYDEENDVLGSDMIGKNISVKATVSEWQGKKMVYANSLEFENGKPKAKNELSPVRTAEISDTELKIELLKLAVDFVKEFGNKNQVTTTKTIIEIAEYFDKHYIRIEKPKEKPDIAKQAVEKAETMKQKKSPEDKETLITEIENLMEEKNAFEMIENILKGQKAENLDDLDITRLNAIKNSLEKTNGK